MPSEKEPEEILLDSDAFLCLGNRFSISPDCFCMSLNRCFFFFLKSQKQQQHETFKNPMWFSSGMELLWRLAKEN